MGNYHVQFLKEAQAYLNYYYDAGYKKNCFLYQCSILLFY